MRVIDCKESMIFFVDGSGGTGKTFLYRTILATLKKASHIAIATATSGIAITFSLVEEQRIPGLRFL